MNNYLFVTRHSSLFTISALILVLFTFISCSCTNKDKEYNPAEKFSQEELKKDLRRIKQYALEEHPALLSESAREKFKESYDKTVSKLNDSLTLVDFYIIARKLVGEINCGHTKLHLPEGYWGKLSETNKHFPFKIYYSDSKMYIKEDYSISNLIPPGSEILSINDNKSSDIINSLMKLVTSDGLNITYKYSQINNIEYGLFPGYTDFPDIYRIKYKRPKEVAVEYTEIHARSRPEILEIMNKKSSEFSRLEYTTIDSLETAILIVKEFIYFPIKEYQQFIRSSFESIKKNRIKNLILDLRGNDGGDPANAAEILSYITRSKPVYFERWVPGYQKLKNPLQHAEPQFNGSLYVLVDGECFSTTGHLLSLIKYHKLGTLVGEESGGSFYCYGCQTDITLPNTKINFSYSQCTYQTKVSGFSTSTGIQPDIYIKPTTEDIIAGRDTELEYILKLISRS